MSHSEFDWDLWSLRCVWKVPQRSEEMELREPLESGSSLSSSPTLLETQGVESVIGHSSFLPCLLLRSSHSPKCLYFFTTLRASEFLLS